MGTILHPSLLPSSLQASASEERSPTKSKPIATQPPAILQQRFSLWNIRTSHWFYKKAWISYVQQSSVWSGKKAFQTQHPTMMYQSIRIIHSEISDCISYKFWWITLALCLHLPQILLDLKIVAAMTTMRRKRMAGTEHLVWRSFPPQLEVVRI